MTLFKCMNIKKEYKDNLVLKNITFNVADKDRIAIVGNNGAGKTTLANIIAGVIEASDGGILWHRKNIKIGYLHQSTYYTQGEFENLVSGEKDEIKDFFHVSKELGIEDIDYTNESRLENLSGGEKTKLALAKVWAEKPGILILDEPTNHMDYEGINWLIEELKKYRGTVLIISHDRYFMDQVVNRVIEIEDGISNEYSGNYTAYREEKRRRYEIQLHEYEVTEKKKQEIQREINQLKYWAEKGHRESRQKEGLKEKYRVRAKKKDKRVKSKIKALEKVEFEGIDKPKEEQVIKFNFVSKDRTSNIILEARDITKKFEEKQLFEKSSFYIKKGERVGLFGKNGCGKTTLINMMQEQLKPDDGSMYFNPSAKVAYLSQDVMNLDGNKTVFETFEIYEYQKRGLLQTLLTNMGFSKRMIYEKVGNLSLGERTRLKVAQMIMMENNVLILDEPTNHLDLHSREMLEKTLSEYEGTLILVSHDRYLLEKLCNKVITFEDKKVNRVEYSFKEYMEIKEEKSNETQENKEEKSKEEELMVIGNRITAVLGELSLQLPGSDKYNKLDEEFKTLIEQKRSLMA